MDTQQPGTGGSTQPASTSQTIVIVGQNKKSTGVALLLSLFFGPLGLLYASVSGGIIMLVVSLFVGFVTLGIGLIVTNIICVIWAVIAVQNHNKKSTQAVQQSSGTTSQSVSQPPNTTNQFTGPVSFEQSQVFPQHRTAVLPIPQASGYLIVIGLFFLRYILERTWVDIIGFIGYTRPKIKHVYIETYVYLLATIITLVMIVVAAFLTKKEVYRYIIIALAILFAAREGYSVYYSIVRHQR